MINKVILQGRLVRDIELKYTQSEVANCEFTVAWSEKYKEVETKCFLRCKAWRKSAEFISRYFLKGQEIIVEGHMTTEEWEKDGERQNRTICVVDKASFCGSKVGSRNTNHEPPSNDGFVHIPDDIDDESLPFN